MPVRARSFPNPDYEGLPGGLPPVVVVRALIRKVPLGGGVGWAAIAAGQTSAWDLTWRIHPAPHPSHAAGLIATVSFSYASAYAILRGTGWFQPPAGTIPAQDTAEWRSRETPRIRILAKPSSR